MTRPYLLCLVFVFAVVQALFISPSYAVDPTVAPESLSESTLLEHETCASSETIYLDHGTDTFAIFSSSGPGAVPRALGKIVQTNGIAQITSTLQIKETDNLYILTRPDDVNFLNVVERLPEGGMGRILRYRAVDPQQGWMDLEFIYEDRENTITILDHSAGRFYRTAFNGKPAEPRSVSPKKEKQQGIELSASPVTPTKFLNPLDSNLVLERPAAQPIVSQRTHFNELSVWLNRLLRGPPAGGLQP